MSLLLSLGPLLHIGTTRTDLKLPYDVLLNLPGVSLGRRPSHFVVIATLMLAPLVATGIHALRARLGPARGRAFLAGTALLLAVEFAPPAWPLHRSEPHPYYRTIRGADGAVMDLPPRYMLPNSLEAQLVHQRPILGGYVARTPSYPFVLYAPGVDELWHGAPSKSQQLLSHGPDQRLATLAAYRIEHVVVNWDNMPPADRRDLQAALDQVFLELPPSFEDDHLSAYRVPQTVARPVAFFGSGWYPEECNGERCWRWMQANGEVVLVNPFMTPQPMTLRLAAESPDVPREVSLHVGEAVLGTWTVQRQVSTRDLALLVPPGEHRLRLGTSVSREPGGNRTLGIVLVDAQLKER